MLKAIAVGLACTAILLSSVSCTPIPTPETAGDKSVPVEKVPLAGSIPSEWGDLIAVTVNPDFAYQYHLWFQDEQGNIRLVDFYIRRMQLLSESRLIPRS